MFYPFVARDDVRNNLGSLLREGVIGVVFHREHVFRCPTIARETVGVGILGISLDDLHGLPSRVPTVLLHESELFSWVH